MAKRVYAQQGGHWQHVVRLVLMGLLCGWALGDGSAASRAQSLGDPAAVPDPAVAQSPAPLSGNSVPQSVPSASWRIDRLAALPDELGVAGPFVGLINDAVVVAGGANFPQGPPWEGGAKVWQTAVYALDRPDGEWRMIGELPQPRGYGVGISLPQGLLCIGGSDPQQHHRQVFLCQWTSAGFQTQPWRPLPIPCANFAGARVGDWIIVVGGSEAPGELSASNRVFGLSLAAGGTPLSEREWRELPACPGPGRLLPGVAVLGSELYVFGGATIEGAATQRRRRYLDDVWQLRPVASEATGWQWRPRRPLPMPLAGTPQPSPTVGQHHFWVLGGDNGSRVDFQPKSAHPGFASPTWLYHRVTDTWTPADPLAETVVTTGTVPWRGGWVLPTGEIRPGVRTPAVWQLQWLPTVPQFGWLNYAVLIAYLLLILVVGTGVAGVARTTDQFFRAGQSIPWWAASLSIFATMLSSITFMSIPAQAYHTGWNLFLGSVYVLLTPLIVYLYLPFFRRLDVTSAYEYLERRFNLAVRWLASSQFICFQLGRIAVVLLLPALALSTVAGIDTTWSIWVVGLLCLAYTLCGGMRAVIWTDAAQAVVLLFGAGWALWHLLWEIPGGVVTVVQGVDRQQRFWHSVPWSWDLTLATGWFIMLGSLFNNLFSYTASQDVVQRYMTTKDERSAALAIWSNAWLSPLAQAVFFAIGSCLLVYYTHFPERLDVGSENDAVFPQFIVSQLPAGVAGLIVAAIFAASQSTISSSLNSVATAYVVDFHQRWKPGLTDAQALQAARWATLWAGLFGLVMALLLARAGIPRSLWETFLTVVGLFSGAVSGLFVLGLFSRRANGPGALVGGATSVAVVLWVYWQQWTTFWLFSAIGVTTCVVVGWLASHAFVGRTSDLSLTIYGQKPTA